jgi:hypothetical protein
MKLYIEDYPEQRYTTQEGAFDFIVKQTSYVTWDEELNMYVLTDEDFDIIRVDSNDIYPDVAERYIIDNKTDILSDFYNIIEKKEKRAFFSAVKNPMDGEEFTIETVIEGYVDYTYSGSDIIGYSDAEVTDIQSKVL